MGNADGCQRGRPMLFPTALPGVDFSAPRDGMQNFLKDLGKADVDTTTYAWNTLGPGGSTGRTTTRGCQTRLFEYGQVSQAPGAGERAHSRRGDVG
jgi:hypothetical protein